MQSATPTDGNPAIIELPRIERASGNLSIVEEECHVPFKFERVSWLYDVPGGRTRSGVAFKKRHEFIIALSGSVHVLVDDAAESREFYLNRANLGLYVPPGYWRQMYGFSTNTVVLVASSLRSCRNDCIRDYEQYVAYRRVD